MCGIAGVINYEVTDLDLLKEALHHRGPDDQTIYTDGALALIHTRLAIQDVLNGRQPFHYGDFTIIWNGEIYNHLALRKLLSEFTFHTRSDTETLLYLYVKYGTEMFAMLDGMYALSIYNKKNNELLLARDRAGKKPLYYLSEAHSFIFASELNAIKTIRKLEIDEAAINCYLRAGFIYHTHTPYKKVCELAPATYMRVKVNECRIMETKKYYDILAAYHSPKESLSLPLALNQVEDELERSVADRLLSSDHEVGVFLSGGIDSNLLVAFAAKLNRRLKTFTVKIDGLYDESALAKLTAMQYQTDHTELEIALHLEQDIEKILTRYGEPFMDSSAVPSYYVAKEAKKKVTVVLNGDGADELFGGYRRYVPVANRLVHHLKRVSAIKSWLPKPKKKQSYYNYLYRLCHMASKTGLDFYLSATSDIYEDIERFAPNPILHAMDQFIQQVFANKNLSPLAQMLYLDFNLLLYSDLLVKMDIATMGHSLEARSPFLSKYMLELSPTLPDHYKIKRWQTKYILRSLAKKYLSDTLIHQPKRGFEVPLIRWVDIDLKDKIYDSLRSGCYAESYVDRRFIDQLLTNKIACPAEKRAKMLWSLFCLEVWYKHQKNY